LMSPSKSSISSTPRGPRSPTLLRVRPRDPLALASSLMPLIRARSFGSSSSTEKSSLSP
jgi:hypothetical protein